MDRAPLIMTVLALALVVVVPTLIWSIIQARRHLYQRHKSAQIATSTALLVLLVFFEAQIPGSNWFSTTAASSFSENTIRNYLAVHKSIAISATLLWTLTFTLALWRMPKPPGPSAHGRLHRILGTSAAVMILITAVSGWIFYWMAFLA